MMPWSTFVRSALFAGLAAALWFPWALAAAPVIGAWSARALYLIAVTAAYVGGLSRQRTRAWPLATAIAFVGVGAALLVSSTAELVIVLAASLGIARSRILYRSTPARALAIESLLLVGGLLFARHLGGYGLISTALALWGFLLVQSVFFLIGGVRPAPLVDRGADVFEEAHRRALMLLNRDVA